jgi:hypothetical protein
MATCLLGFPTRGFSPWATLWATSDAARSGRARAASAVARGAGGPGGPDALGGLPGGPWRRLVRRRHNASQRGRRSDRGGLRGRLRGGPVVP